VKAMERQTGLGRSLEDVLESLTPAEADPAGPGRVMFEPEDLEQQLDQLMGDITALRERVQHLVGMVPDSAVLRVIPGADAKSATSTTNTKTKKKHKKPHGKRNGKKAKKHGQRHVA
jgi:hypothetical protein